MTSSYRCRQRLMKSGGNGSVLAWIGWEDEREPVEHFFSYSVSIIIPGQFLQFFPVPVTFFASDGDFFTRCCFRRCTLHVGSLKSLSLLLLLLFWNYFLYFYTSFVHLLSQIKEVGIAFGSLTSLNQCGTNGLDKA